MNDDHCVTSSKPAIMYIYQIKRDFTNTNRTLNCVPERKGKYRAALKQIKRTADASAKPEVRATKTIELFKALQCYRISSNAKVLHLLRNKN